MGAIVRAFLKKKIGSPFTEEELKDVATLETRVASTNYVAPEDKLAALLKLHEDVDDHRGSCENRCYDFVVSWRRAFVNALQPNFFAKGLGRPTKARLWATDA